MSTTQKIRLNRYIALCGYCSRHEAEKLILSGQILVNRFRELNPARQVHPKKDSVRVLTGPFLKLHKNEKTLIFYKPANCVFSQNGEKSIPSVYDHIPSEFHHLKPQDRLRKDEEGIIIFANGKQENHGTVEYHLQTEESTNEKRLKLINWKFNKRKINLRIKQLSKSERSIRVKTNIQKSSMLRRELSRYHVKISHLKRTKIGNFEIDTLKPGEYLLFEMEKPTPNS